MIRSGMQAGDVIEGKYELVRLMGGGANSACGSVALMLMFASFADFRFDFEIRGKNGQNWAFSRCIFQFTHQQCPGCPKTSSRTPRHLNQHATTTFCTTIPTRVPTMAEKQPKYAQK